MPRQKWTNDMANKWKNYKPPIRPSKDDLAVFRQFLEKKIKEKKNPKVLILGSTPEFRDLINSKGLTAYVCDYKKDNYTALKLLKKTKGKEILIAQDWRNLKLKHKFDLVFAEASLNMVKKKEVPLILRSVRQILDDKGLFIAKTWIRISTKNLSLKKIIATYRRKYKGKDFKNWMNQELHSYRYKEDKGSLHRQYLWFRELYGKGTITKKEFSSIEGLSYETTPLTLFLPTKTEFLKIAKKHMKIEEIIIPKQVGTNKIPIYVLGK